MANEESKGEDELMSFETRPKRAPPKGIGIKPSKKTDDDEEMVNEEEDMIAPPKRSPARAPK